MKTRLDAIRKREIVSVCRKIKCGLCCENGWVVIVTENDLKRWEETHPEILNELTTEEIDDKMETVIKRYPAKSPRGHDRKICAFYDFEEKCRIYDVKPEMCQKFSCVTNQFFMFQWLNKITEFIAEQEASRS